MSFSFFSHSSFAVSYNGISLWWYSSELFSNISLMMVMDESIFLFTMSSNPLISSRMDLMSMQGFFDSFIAFIVSTLKLSISSKTASFDWQSAMRETSSLSLNNSSFVSSFEPDLIASMISFLISSSSNEAIFGVSSSALILDLMSSISSSST